MLIDSSAARAGVMVAPGTAWKYFKGISEASTPDTTAWRAWDFNDSNWSSGQAPFYYEDQPGSSTAFTGNTALSDMKGAYTCIFLRRTFVVTNVNDYQGLQVAGYSDDGFLAWLNGNLVGRFNMPADEVAYDRTSSPALAEPISWWTNDITDFRNFLRVGTNLLAVQAFNSSLSASSDFVIDPALYFTGDLEAPLLSFFYPEPNSAVRQLGSVEVAFNEAVSGVEASDLLINGLPATEMTIVSPSQFVFTFPQPPTGVVQVAWAATHGIRDQSTASNLFAGGSWSYTLNPNAPVPGVIISEFMASNSGELANSVHDELANAPDWIELYNTSASGVNLANWSLTDNADRPAKWRFPSVVLPGKGFLVVFASGRDTNVNGQLHTSFRISSTAGFLGLFDPSGNLVSAFAPQYPQQQTDVSYGRDALDPPLVGYYTNATPGAANASRGTGFGDEVRFSRAGGTFLSEFTLTLSPRDTNCDIRYVLFGTNVPSGSLAPADIPTSSSSLYTGPITVSNTVAVRARSFPRTPGYWPGPPHTECFIKVSSGAAAFGSDLPIILLHNLAGGTVPQTTDQSIIGMVFEPVNGRASVTNPPSLVFRGGLNIRGSSTAGEPQSSFALELWDEYNQDSPSSFLGLPEESDWVLFGQNGYDRSLLHNPLSHQLSRNIGRYSSRTKFAEVFLNTAGGAINYSAPVGGNYFGIYTIEEKVKRDKARVDIEELAPQVATLPDLSGGYLLKIDRADANERGFYNAALQNNVVFQDPPGLEMVSAARLAQYNYITTYFTQFGNALWGASYTNPATGYAQWIDVDSWIDHHILNVLPFNVDAFRLSGYFFKDRNQKLEMGPLWDFDRSLGSTDNRCFNPRLWRVQSSGDQGTDFFGNPALLGVRWWQRLFTDPDFWQSWIDRWTDLRRGELATNHIFAVIDSLTNQIRQAQARQQQRWANSAPRSGAASAYGYTHTFNGTYAGEINFLKKWLTDRTEFIDTNFLRAPVFSAAGGPIEPGFRLTITAPTIESNTITYYTLDGTDPRLPGGAIAPYALSGVQPVSLLLTNNARVFARNYNPTHSNMTGGLVGGNPPISSPWSGPQAETFILEIPQLVITEIMFHPAGGGGIDPDSYEFIELKNVGSRPLSLLGTRFTNGISFTFSATNPITSLAPNQYLVLVKNRAAFSSRYPGVTNIAGEYSGSLDNSGETLAFEGPVEEPIQDFHFSDSWYPSTDGLGFSLVIRNESGPPEGWTNAANWRASTRLHGSPGQPDPAPTTIPPVVINEVLTHTDPPQLDTIEFYNPTDAPAVLTGWFLSDDREVPRKYQMPVTEIPAFGYALVTEDLFNNGGSNSFALSSLGDEVYLFSGDGTNLTGYSHGFNFGPQVNGVTFGRHVTTDGREHLVTQKRNTLGGANAGPRIGPIVISEIMFSPGPADPLDEYVELRNVSKESQSLFDPLHPANTWRLDGGIHFLFPEGTAMPGGAVLLIVNFDPEFDPLRLSWFRSRYGIPDQVVICGPFSSKLANEGDRVALYFPDKPELPPSPLAGWAPLVLAEEVNYSNAAPWPAGVDGTGKSLSRTSCFAFGDEPANWQAGVPSPGFVNPVSTLADADSDGLPDEWEWANALDPQDDGGSNGPTGDPDGDGASNWHEYVAGSDPLDSSDYLRFESVQLEPTLCVLQFRARTGRVYSIESRVASDESESWSVVLDNILGAGVQVKQMPLGPEGTLYRLRASLAP